MSDTILNDTPGRPGQTEILPIHHIPDVPDNGKFCQIGIDPVHLSGHQVGDTGSRHLLIPMKKTVDLKEPCICRLTDMVIDYHYILRFEPGLHQKSLLSGPEIRENFQGIIIGNLMQGERIKLTKKNRLDRNFCTGKSLG